MKQTQFIHHLSFLSFFYTHCSFHMLLLLLLLLTLNIWNKKIIFFFLRQFDRGRLKEWFNLIGWRDISSLHFFHSFIRENGL